AQQERTPPFGGIAGVGADAMQRLFLSPGPIAEGQGRGARSSGQNGAGHNGRPPGDHWGMGRGLFAHGFRSGQTVINNFSYHLTPAGIMFDEAARGLGCAVFPGGIGNTDAQVDAIARFAITGYVGTPEFLKIILEKADEKGIDLAHLQRASVTGGPLFPQVATWYAERGVHVRQTYGTAELGLVAYQTENLADGFVVDEHCIVEIVRPGTGEVVAPGEVGEVVVTTFDPHYPLIRLATGDLSCQLEGDSACGRTNMRLKGWMGRADQTTKVKGMFVHPSQVARILAAFQELEKARLEVSSADGRDVMLLRCETTAAHDNGLEDRVAAALQSETRLSGMVELHTPGALPNDGLVIADLRESASA
ncbi:MAG: AMP-binding protein, partial [Pseudomonadota bacterium]